MSEKVQVHALPEYQAIYNESFALKHVKGHEALARRITLYRMLADLNEDHGDDFNAERWRMVATVVAERPAGKRERVF